MILWIQRPISREHTAARNEGLLSGMPGKTFRTERRLCKMRQPGSRTCASMGARETMHVGFRGDGGRGAESRDAPAALGLASKWSAGPFSAAMAAFFKRSRRLLVFLTIATAVAPVAGLLFVLAANLYTTTSTRSLVYSDPAALPGRDVALVLGANRRTYHLQNRLQAAARLYEAGKVRHVLVSGDNHSADYDEPSAMRRRLIELGVPEEAITCDYAGFRTLDSVVRAKRIFGLDRLTIVSQEFHDYRALLIARRHGIDAVAFCAEEPPEGHRQVTRKREVLARALTVLDLYVLNRQPRFLGDEEPILLSGARSARAVGP